MKQPSESCERDAGECTMNRRNQLERPLVCRCGGAITRTKPPSGGTLRVTHDQPVLRLTFSKSEPRDKIQTISGEKTSMSPLAHRRCFSTPTTGSSVVPRHVARDELLAALEAAPGYRPAQKMLLEIMQSEQGK